MSPETIECLYCRRIIEYHQNLHKKEQELLSLTDRIDLEFKRCEYILKNFEELLNKISIYQGEIGPYFRSGAFKGSLIKEIKEELIKNMSENFFMQFISKQHAKRSRNHKE